MTHSIEDRILGALCLAGMGDALGAPTEQYTIDEIAARHGGLVIDFAAPESDTFAGVLGLRPGEVTDDASQLYYLARHLVAAGGRLDNAGWLRCLLDWADTSGKDGFMGPSTRAVVAALREGADVARLARIGTIGASSRKMAIVGNTNGAAMRVAACGLVHPGRVTEACELAFVTCGPSHDTDVAIAGAACIAAGTAQALVSDGPGAVIEACLQGAALGERLGRERARAVPGPRLSARAQMALRIATTATDDRAFLVDMEAQVGNSVLAAESVPAALGVFAYAGGDPMRCIALGASIGNDTDTIATMAGALAGGLHGAAVLPAGLLEQFLAVNEATYQLRALARGLAALAGPARASTTMPGVAGPSFVGHDEPAT